MCILCGTCGAKLVTNSPLKIEFSKQPRHTANPIRKLAASLYHPKPAAEVYAQAARALLTRFPRSH